MRRRRLAETEAMRPDWKSGEVEGNTLTNPNLIKSIGFSPEGEVVKQLFSDRVSVVDINNSSVRVVYHSEVVGNDSL